MADFELAAPTDLPLLRSLKNDGNGYSVFDGGGFEVRVSDRLDAEGRGLFGAAMCSVVTAGEGAETANAFLMWSSRPEAFEMWEEVAGDGTALVLRSTTWREPKMEVSLTMGPESVRLKAEETDLES
ncbi:hypothetical protein [Jannaschia pohangensis]|nr:hypothetical protein [Jannaschia pohangensis]